MRVLAFLAALAFSSAAWAQSNNPTPKATTSVFGKITPGTGCSITTPGVLDCAGTGAAPAGSAGDIQTYATSTTFGTITPAAGIATFLATPSGANLATALTTALPATKGGTGLTSLGTGVATALGVNVGSVGAVVVNGGALGTPSSGVLTSATGLPISTGVSGLGTGTATALAVNVGSAGAVVVNGGALGTPSSGTLTSATGLPISTGVSGLGTGVATALGINTGSAGALVVNGGALGTPSSGVATSLTGTAAGLTAGNVTTNANLTGPVTSVGNATAFATMTSNAFLTGNGTSLPNQVAITGVVLGKGASAPAALPALAHTQSSVAAPTGTTNTTGLMMGLAGTVTPAYSGTVRISVCGDIVNGTVNDGANVQLRTGTGTAPVNAAALTGTTRGSLIKFVQAGAGAYKVPFCVIYTVTGLSTGTAYWIDVGLAAVTGGTASIGDVDIVADEIL